MSIVIISKYHFIKINSCLFVLKFGTFVRLICDLTIVFLCLSDTNNDIKIYGTINTNTLYKLHVNRRTTDIRPRFDSIRTHIKESNRSFHTYSILRDVVFRIISMFNVHMIETFLLVGLPVFTRW